MFSNMKLGVRLGTGFGIVLALLLLVGAYGLGQMRFLSDLNRKMYEHPFTVSNAVLRIDGNIVRIHRAMKDVALSETIADIDTAIKIVDNLEKKVLSDFAIISTRFLGHKAMYLNAEKLFRDWKPIRDEVIANMRSGQRREAAEITKGKGASHVEKIVLAMNALNEFAQGKANSFFVNTQQTLRQGYLLMVFVIGAAIVLGGLLTLFITRSITKPAVEIAEVSEAIAKGDLTRRITYRSMDEIGQMAESLRRMLAGVIGEGQSIKNGLPIPLWTVDRHLILTFINPTAAQLLEAFTKRKAEQMVGRMLLEDAIQDANGLIIKMARESLDSGARKEAVVEFKSDIGSSYYQHVTSPLVDLEGLTIGVMGVGIEITERKLAEEALRAREAQYRDLYEESKKNAEVHHSLLHSSADAIVMYDLEGRTQFLSPRFTEIFGWTMDELKGKRIPFLPESEKTSTMERIKALVENGAPTRNFETKRCTKDGRIIDVSISASRFEDHEGKPAGLMVIHRDISETKRLEAQLQQAQKMEAVGTLAGGIAHDFNNLLQAINGYTQILIMGKESNAPDYKNLMAILKAGERAAQLVRQLLFFSRKVEAERRPVNLSQEIEQALKLLERTIPKMIEIEFHPGSRLWAVSADCVQMEQVLLNLGSNAKDAMPDGGKLIIETKNVTLDKEYARNHIGVAPGNYVLLTVSDTGQGMDKETLEHLFEPFYTTKDIGQGTGLGLASVYGIVKGHEGNITCYSEIGQGTSFNIYLPALEPEKDRTETGLFKTPPKGGTETILLVDDEETVIDFAAQALQQFGYTVLHASSGEEALDIYNSGKYEIDLVILDLGMPGMGGHRCLRELLTAAPTVKVLIASGYSINGQVQATLKAGAAGFIGKPYDITVLLNKVRAVMDESKREMTPGKE